MLVVFRTKVGRQINPLARALLDADFMGQMELFNRPLDTRMFASVAFRFGLSALNVPGLTQLSDGTFADPLAAFDVLRRRGPFIFGGLIEGRSGHAIVICGATDSGEFDIEFIDPRYGNHAHLPFATFQRGFPPDGGPLFVF